MIIPKSINYTLTIDVKEGHGISYEQNLENDIAGLMIAAQVLQINLDYLKDAKKSTAGAEKKILAKKIAFMSRTLAANKELAMSLCDNYEMYKLAADMHKKKMEAQEQTIPKIRRMG